MTIKITLDEFKLIKSFYPEFSRKIAIRTNEFVVGWSEIMPVVDEIESLGCYEIIIRSTHVKASSFDPFNIHLIFTQAITEEVKKIEAVYKAVIEFIKWYKEHTNDIN